VRNISVGNIFALRIISVGKELFILLPHISLELLLSAGRNVGVPKTFFSPILFLKWKRNH
jgi:hypothetical protein